MRIALAIVLAAALVCAAAFAADANAGQAAFLKACKTCHGAQGQGNPAIAKALNVAIPDLGSKAVQEKSDAEIKKVVTDGKGKMKPVKTISGGEISDVVAFLRTLKK